MGREEKDAENKLQQIRKICKDWNLIKTSWPLYKLVFKKLMLLHISMQKWITYWAAGKALYSKTLGLLFTKKLSPQTEIWPGQYHRWERVQTNWTLENLRQDKQIEKERQSDQSLRHYWLFTVSLSLSFISKSGKLTTKLRQLRRQLWALTSLDPSLEVFNDHWKRRKTKGLELSIVEILRDNET